MLPPKTNSSIQFCHNFEHTILYLLEICGIKLEISSVHVMHTMKLRFHEQTDIRYNPALFLLTLPKQGQILVIYNTALM